MLNRRILRSKAVQTLYAFMQCREANYEIALQHIEDLFQPDLNSMEVQDRPLLKKQSAAARKLFGQRFIGKSLTPHEDPAVEDAAQFAAKRYQEMVKKDFQFFKKQLLAEAEQIYDWYLLTLMALPALVEAEPAEDAPVKKEVGAIDQLKLRKLKDNQAIQILIESSTINNLAIKRHINWGKEEKNLRKWLRDIVKKNETFIQWAQKESSTLQEDIELASYLCKEIVLKNEHFVQYFEDQDSRWVENKPTIKSLVNKTLKDLAESNGALKLMDLSPNWEEDKAFFEQIFVSTVENDAQYEEIIATRALNWDTERIALVDKAIMMLALDEMINFPGIPVKVTINEYIDISKNFSTPKSKQFINGLLDKASNDLKKQGIIKKSGRGLIDNK